MKWRRKNLIIENNLGKLLIKAYLPLNSVFIDQLTQSHLNREQLRNKGLGTKLQILILPFDRSETF